MKLVKTVLLLVATSSGMVAATPGRLPFIADDYAKARAEASRNKLPLFVDVWAPW